MFGLHEKSAQLQGKFVNYNIKKVSANAALLSLRPQLTNSYRLHEFTDSGVFTWQVCIYVDSQFKIQQ